MATLKTLAQDAIDCQNACNLSGIAHAFARACSDLRTLLPKAGTDEINNHPICRLWSDKIAHLTGTQSYGHENMMKAYEECYKLAAG